MSDTPRNIRPFYEIVVEIGGEDFSQNLTKISIMSSIRNPYQSIILTLMADNKLMIRKNLFGKEDIKLKIQKLEIDNSVSETVELNLITVNQKVPLSLKHSDPLNIDELETIVLTNIVKEPYTYMSTTVNMLFDESKRLSPIDMVSEISKTFMPDMAVNIIDNNKNEEPPYQFIVPPMSFINSIKYIDGSFKEISDTYGTGLGIFNGPMFFTCRFELDDKHKFCMWDLGKMAEGKEEYTVYQISLGGIDENVAKDISSDKNKFMTIGRMNYVYRGNQDVMLSSYTNKFLSKPSNELYSWKTITMDEVFEENSIKDGGSLDINDLIKKRLSFITIGEVGLEESDVPYRARMSRRISTLSEIEFSIQRDVILELLTRVGVPVYIDPQVEDYKKLGGKYIVSSSKIDIVRETDRWTATALIRAFRSNLEK